MNELIKALEKLRERILEAWQILELDSIQEEIKKLEVEMSHPDFWNNQEKAKLISQQTSHLQEEIKIWKFLLKEVNDTIEIAILDKDNHDVNLQSDIEKQYKQILQEFERKEFLLMMNSAYDKKDTLINIHAGTGGTDAQDWAQMLMRMILRYSQKQGFTAEIIEKSVGGEAGIKSCMIKIQGLYSYGYLKSEHGVHRLVRISPFDAEKMRHTSFALIEVMPLLQEQDIKELDLKQKDLRVDTFRASGAGGQHVNKTDSAVRITHIPTGLVAACQSERSQLQNKETAMRILKSKLFQYQQLEQEEEKSRLKGEYNEAAWGNHIRSYVLHPYKMVKDVRTSYETAQVQDVLDGYLDELIEAYLRSKIKSS